MHQTTRSARLDLSATISVEQPRVAARGLAVVGARAPARVLLAITLGLILLAGFGLRAYRLSAEGLSDDELNKLHAVADYRAHGLTSANGEHPFLMKALLTVSVVAAEKWDATSLVTAHPEFNIPVESALRFPVALFGTLTVVIMF